MKKLKFTIPIYDFDITLIQIEGKEDKEKVIPFMNAMKCQQEFIDEVTDYIERECVDGGETYRNFDMRKILVIFCPMSNKKMQANIYSHEKRHIEDRVLEFSSVNDIESAGLLAGFLGGKFYEFWNKVTNK